MAWALYSGTAGLDVDAPPDPVGDREGRFATLEAAMARAAMIGDDHFAIVADARVVLIAEGSYAEDATGACTRTLVWRAIDGAPVPTVDPQLAAVLADDFPPRAPLPPAALCRAHLDWIRREAQGLPGDPVTPRLFPDERTKNARLLLTIAGELWPSRALHRARGAYAPTRSHHAAPPSYHAHDAVACALLEPGLPRAVKQTLIEHLCADTAATRGWRSRRKTWRVWRWAAALGLVDWR